MTTIKQIKKLAISPEVNSILQAIGGRQTLRGISQPSSMGYSDKQIFFAPFGAKGTIWLTANADQVLAEYKVFLVHQRRYQIVGTFCCLKDSLMAQITELLRQIENQEVAIDG